jgi:hypothetical protein
VQGFVAIPPVEAAALDPAVVQQDFNDLAVYGNHHGGHGIRRIGHAESLRAAPPAARPKVRQA